MTCAYCGSRLSDAPSCSQCGAPRTEAVTPKPPAPEVWGAIEIGYRPDGYDQGFDVIFEGPGGAREAVSFTEVELAARPLTAEWFLYSVQQKAREKLGPDVVVDPTLLVEAVMLRAVELSA